MPFDEGASMVSGTLYLSGQEHCKLLNEVYGRFSHTNPMHADVFPSIRQMELEVLAMTAAMVGGGQVVACILVACGESLQLVWCCMQRGRRRLGHITQFRDRQPLR